MATRIEIRQSSTPASTPVGATLMKTGQTVSYRTGDDGDIEAGRATSFLTLDAIPLHNNGSATINTTTARFTDELGGQTYTNNIVLDWSTWNGSTLLGYRRTIAGNVTWDIAIDSSAAISIGTFTSGWRLANARELINITNWGATGSSVMDYSPLNISTHSIWSSTTDYGNSANAAYTNTSVGNLAYLDKTIPGAKLLAVRTFSLSTSNILS